MSREKEIMRFLDDQVFNPVLDLRTATADLKQNTVRTQKLMSRLPADRMIRFFWSAIANRPDVAERFRGEGFPLFEDVKDEFARQFPPGPNSVKQRR